MSHNQSINISKYDFHDGYIICMQYINAKLDVLMESAELLPEETTEDLLVLSKHNTLKGVLHIEQIQSIIINNIVWQNRVIQKQSGDIFSFAINNNVIILEISWLQPYGRTDLDIFKITADTIWWENIPDLNNPLWPENS